MHSCIATGHLFTNGHPKLFNVSIDGVVPSIALSTFSASSIFGIACNKLFVYGCLGEPITSCIVPFQQYVLHTLQLLGQPLHVQVPNHV